MRFQSIRRKRTLLKSGATPEAVDERVAEVGAPTEYIFELDFEGQDSRHYESTPQVARNVGEVGDLCLRR